MPEINALPVATAMTDDDLLVIYENGAASNKTRQITAANALADYAKRAAAATFTVLVGSTSIASPSGAIDSLTVANSLIIGATVQKILTATGTLTLPTINSATEGSASFTVTGAVVGDQVLLQLPGTFPAGLILSRAVVTGANTVTAYFYNVTGGNIAGAGYTIRASAIRFA